MRRPGNATGEAPIVLITFPDYDTEHPQHGGALTAAGYVMRIAPKRGLRSPEELLALSADVAAAIVSTDPFTADVLRDSVVVERNSAPRRQVFGRAAGPVSFQPGEGGDGRDLGQQDCRGAQGDQAKGDDHFGPEE